MLFNIVIYDQEKKLCPSELSMIFFITLGPEVIESEYERKIKKTTFCHAKDFGLRYGNAYNCQHCLNFF